MKNKILIYILALSIFIMNGCTSNNIIDKNRELDIPTSTDISTDKNQSTDENSDIEKNIDEDKDLDEDKDVDEDMEIDDKEINPPVSPKHSGLKFDIDLDKYKSVLPLTEGWEFYHDAQKKLKKDLLTIDGTVFDDSVLFFEYKDKYIAIVSDKNDYSSTFIGLMKKEDSDFKVEFLERFQYSFNSAKEEVLLKDNEIILMTQFPFSAYSLFGKFIDDGDGIVYDSLVDYDSSVDYYTEFMELLNEGAMDKAMDLEDYSSYPFSYENLYFRSGNLAIKKSLEFAELAVEKNNEVRAKELLEWGLTIYLEKHYNYEFDKEHVSFDNVYIKTDKDFGYEYVLANDFMFAYLDFYLERYIKFEDDEKSKLLIENIEVFKEILGAEEMN